MDKQRAALAIINLVQVIADIGRDVDIDCSTELDESGRVRLSFLIADTESGEENE